MHRAALVSLLVLTACHQAGADVPPAPEPVLPRAAPAIFRSIDKNLTFPTPPGSTFCPLADHWVGSDHGTIVFLTPPNRCGAGGGYPSSARGALTAPNIQVYYGYDTAEYEVRPPPDPCEEVGRVVVLGRDRPLCVARDGSRVEVRVEAPYMAEGYEADIDSDAVFTLVTADDRLSRDMETFRALVIQAGTCNRTDVENGPPYPNPRPNCPAGAMFF